MSTVSTTMTRMARAVLQRLSEEEACMTADTLKNKPYFPMGMYVVTRDSRTGVSVDQEYLAGTQVVVRRGRCARHDHGHHEDGKRLDDERRFVMHSQFSTASEPDGQRVQVGAKG